MFVSMTLSLISKYLVGIRCECGYTLRRLGWRTLYSGAGKDRLSANALVSEFVDERMIERQHECLGATVDPVQSLRRDRYDRRNVDDRAAAAADESRHRGIGQAGRRGDIKTDHLLHLVDIGGK